MTTKATRFDAHGRADAAKALAALRRHPLTFGSHLRAIRLGEELTQLEMAKGLGITNSHLSDIENERKVVSVERAARWAETLGYHPAYFVRMVLSDEVRRAGLDLRVTVKDGRAA